MAYVKVFISCMRNIVIAWFQSMHVTINLSNVELLWFFIKHSLFVSKNDFFVYAVDIGLFCKLLIYSRQTMQLHPLFYLPLLSVQLLTPSHFTYIRCKYLDSLKVRANA